MSRNAGRAVALVVVAVTVALAPGRAMAHTELDFSLPADGTTVGEPIEEISVGFTDQVALVGNGFEVHDPQGNLLTPFVVTDDNKVFRFQLDPPLAGGVVTVDYHVRALDGDVQEGSFSFTVAAPLVTSTSTSTAIGSATTIATTGTDVATTVPAVVGAEPATCRSHHHALDDYRHEYRHDCCVDAAQRRIRRQRAHVDVRRPARHRRRVGRIPRPPVAPPGVTAFAGGG